MIYAELPARRVGLAARARGDTGDDDIRVEALHLVARAQRVRG